MSQSRHETGYHWILEKCKMWMRARDLQMLFCIHKLNDELMVRLMASWFNSFINTICDAPGLHIMRHYWLSGKAIMDITAQSIARHETEAARPCRSCRKIPRLSRGLAFASSIRLRKIIVWLVVDIARGWYISGSWSMHSFPRLSLFLLPALFENS